MKTSSFDAFGSETLNFLVDLKANNNRDWFAANKQSFETVYKQPAANFSAELSLALSEITGHLNIVKVFRVYRDVRFSKDKTPYNAHLHISFTADIAGASPPMWFFGVDSERLSLGCGNFGFDEAHLEQFRKRIVSDEGAKIVKMVNKLKVGGARFIEPELKRVPSGYAKDHEYNDFLRHKSFSGWLDYPPEAIIQGGLVSWCVSEFKKLLPLYGILMHR